MAKRPPRTILEACTRKRGIHRGALTAAHVAQYAIATAELGHVPSNREYVTYWSVSERTGWNHREGIAEVFGARWPEVVQGLADELERRSTRSLHALARFPLPA